MKYFKITNSNETHNGIKYKKGLIEDPLPWNPDTYCAPGGIYFTDKKHIYKFLDFGIWLRKVTIPDDAKVSFGDEKHKANKVIIGKRWDLRKVKTWEYLVSIDADIHAQDDYPLNWAAEKGYLEVVKYLVQQGANVRANYDFPLRSAVIYGHLEVVKYLVEQGADIHTKNDYPLRWAAHNGYLEVVKYLVQKGANIYARDNNDYPLILAEYNNHAEVVNYLRKKMK